MAVKEKYNHSIALTKEYEDKLVYLRQKGYSLNSITKHGMDFLLVEIATKKDNRPATV